MDAAATLVGRQAAWLQAGEPLPEAPRAVDRELHAAGCSSRAVGAAKGSSECTALGWYTMRIAA
jgi:hypothetical protein